MSGRTYDRPWRPSDPPRVASSEWGKATTRRPAPPVDDDVNTADWARIREQVQALLATDHPARDIILALRADLALCEDVATAAQLTRDQAIRALDHLRLRYDRLALVARILSESAPGGLFMLGSSSVTVPYGVIRELRRVLAEGQEQQEP